MKVKVLFIILAITTVLLYAQPPIARTYSNEIPERYYIGNDIYEDADGNFIIAGETDKYIELRYGGENHIFEGNAFLMKTDNKGNILWNKEYGDMLSMQGAHCFEKTPDNGFLIAAYNKYIEDTDAWLIKTDENGDSMWTKIIPHALPKDMISTIDSGYIFIADYFGPLGEIAFQVVKINSSGEVIWRKNYSRSAGEEIYTIKELKNGDLIICATTPMMESTTIDIWILKTNAIGDTLWTTIIYEENYSLPEAIFITEDNNLILFSEYTFEGLWGLETHPSIAKLDSTGNLLWKKNFLIDDYSLSDMISSVIYNNDGNYSMICNSLYVATSGYWVKNINILNINEDGTINSNYMVNDNYFINANNGYAYHLDSKNAIPTAENGIAITGTRRTSYNSYTQIFFLNLDKSEITGINSFEEEKDFTLNNCYPNPFNPITTISYELAENSQVELSIYDLNGNLIKTLVNSFQYSGKHETIWNASEYASGIYFYQLRTDKQTLSKKMILIK